MNRTVAVPPVAVAVPFAASSPVVLVAVTVPPPAVLVPVAAV
jgi:hypothetical protein